MAVLRRDREALIGLGMDAFKRVLKAGGDTNEAARVALETVILLSEANHRGAVIRHAIRLCERHAEEWVPDENDQVCLFVESLTCEGEQHRYVHDSQLRGAVSLLDEFDRYASTDGDYAGSPFEAKVRAFLDSHQLGGQ